MCLCALQENAVLRGQKEDLHAQLLHQHIQEGRLLLNHRTSTSDIELEKLPKAEVNILLHLLILHLHTYLHCVSIELIPILFWQ